MLKKTSGTTSQVTPGVLATTPSCPTEPWATKHAECLVYAIFARTFLASSQSPMKQQGLAQAGIVSLLFTESIHSASDSHLKYHLHVGMERVGMSYVTCTSEGSTWRVCTVIWTLTSASYCKSGHSKLSDTIINRLHRSNTSRRPGSDSDLAGGSTRAIDRVLCLP